MIFPTDALSSVVDARIDDCFRLASEKFPADLMQLFIIWCHGFLRTVYSFIICFTLPCHFVLKNDDHLVSAMGSTITSIIPERSSDKNLIVSFSISEFPSTLKYSIPYAFAIREISGSPFSSTMEYLSL